MKPHQNLFAYYENKAAVYSTLQSDYLRNNKRLQWWANASLIFMVLIIADTAMTDSKWKFVFLVGLAFCAIQYIILCADQSNLNFLMHAIDWLEAKDSEPENTDNP